MIASEKGLAMIATSWQATGRNPIHPLSKVLLSILLQVGLLSVASAQPVPAFNDTIPSFSYYQAIEELYRGEYRDAERQFIDEIRGAVKIGVTGRWIDAICYHTMLGETYYQQGLPAKALEQFDLACALYLQYPDWMIRVTFEPPRPDTNVTRRVVPWGGSNRQFTLGKFRNQMRYTVGDLGSGQRALRSGGVVQQLQFWQINVIEVIRCTALSIRRRNELLGPLAPNDATTKALVSALSRGATAPNHWSNAWVDLQLGLAYVGQGKVKQALPRLVRSERVAGQFDHPLTCVTLLEQGRLAMEAGKSAEANRLLSEASYSAFYFEDIGTIDEAFRLLTLNRLASSISAVNPMLEPAAAWARRDRFHHIFARLNLAFAKELMRLEDWERAAGAIKTAQARMRDAARARLGNQAQYLMARGLIVGGNTRGQALLDKSLLAAAAMSTRNFQIGLTNRQYDSRQISARRVSNVYQSLLSDPSASDWVFRPLEMMAVIKTPHGAAFDRWIDAEFAQKRPAKALEVSDLVKRRNYLAMLPLTGRTLALADLLEAPPAELTQKQRTTRNDLLLRVPDYQTEMQRGLQLREQIRAQWVDGLEPEAQRKLVKLWRDWDSTLANREQLLTKLALSRIPTTVHFPPQYELAALKAKLKPGQAVLVFHNSQQGMLGFLVTSGGSTHWNCGSAASLSRPLTKFLQDIGNYGPTHDMSTEELLADEWLVSGGKLFDALLGKSSIDVHSLEELIVVPDDLLWYVPFGALPIQPEQSEEVIPLIAKARIRVTPTFSTAVGSSRAWRRVQRSAAVGLAIVPGEKEEDQQRNLKKITSALEHPIQFPEPLPVPAAAFGSMLEELVVLSEQEINSSSPLAWDPLPTKSSAKGSSLGSWLGLPREGPQRLVYPGLRTIAESGGKPSRRKRSGVPGRELFMASCGLIASGAETVLMSRWKVGGESTMEITSEFVQELPYTSASDSWQRAVQLVRELPIDPSREPRVKAGKDDPPLTASHPIFWSGYLLVDSGLPSPAESGAEPQANESIQPPAAK